MATISITLKELEAIKAAEYKRGYRDGQSVIATGDVVKPAHEVGFAKPAAKVAKVEPVSAELRAKVAAQLSADIANAKAKGERKHCGGKYYFNGMTATKVGYAAISAGSFDPNGMKDITVLAIAKDYGIK